MTKINTSRSAATVSSAKEGASMNMAVTVCTIATGLRDSAIHAPSAAPEGAVSSHTANTRVKIMEPTSTLTVSDSGSVKPASRAILYPYCALRANDATHRQGLTMNVPKNNNNKPTGTTVNRSKSPLELAPRTDSGTIIGKFSQKRASTRSPHPRAHALSFGFELIRESAW